MGENILNEAIKPLLKNQTKLVKVLGLIGIKKKRFRNDSENHPKI